MPVILSCHDLSRSYDIRPLFEGLSFAIEEGERVALIGPNGSGKSTLMRILAGLEQPDEGERAVARDRTMVYLPQQDRFEETTPRAVLLAAVPKHLPEHQHDAIAAAALTKASFTAELADRPVDQLSGGWRKRLAISRALMQAPDLLLLDEPTNHLDIEGIWWLERTMASLRTTVVMVSHDRTFLERVATRVIELNKAYPGGNFSSYGSYSTFLEKRAEFIANQNSRQEVLDNQVRRAIDWLRRGPKAQTVKAAARIDDAERKIAELSELKYRNSQHKSAAIDFTASGRRTNDLVVLTEVSKALGGRPLFRDLTMTLSPGMRLGLLGLNGSGKTSLLKVIAGKIEADAGKIKRAFELKIVYFEQTRAALNQQQTLRKALCPTGDTVMFRDRGMHIASWAKRFLFRPEQLDLEVSKLSGGEQARVLIADLMRKPADLLILDEPTNDLDIQSLEVLEENLCDFPGALVMVTHDRFLLDRVSNCLLALDGSGSADQVADYAQWEDFAKRREEQRVSAAMAATAPVKNVATKAVANTAKGLSSKERRELEGMAEKLAAAEAALAAVDTRLNDPAVTSDPDALEKACADLADAQAGVDAVYARWQELEARANG
jgi:ABC transport system ATP-binding/permease protein